ncbi:MAG: hypothetical protein Tsb002_16320 [Wenzhouxiangellaceae bacterium]
MNHASKGLIAILALVITGIAAAAPSCPTYNFYKVEDQLYLRHDIERVTGIVDLSAALSAKGSALPLGDIDLGALPLPRISLPPPVLELPDEPQPLPDICELYFETFNPDAAACACEVFADAVRKVSHPFQAVVIGHYAGRSFEETGECPL